VCVMSLYLLKRIKVFPRSISLWWTRKRKSPFFLQRARHISWKKRTRVALDRLRRSAINLLSPSNCTFVSWQQHTHALAPRGGRIYRRYWLLLLLRLRIEWPGRSIFSSVCTRLVPTDREKERETFTQQQQTTSCLHRAHNKNTHTRE
jgi:hypothetical protein